MTADFEVKKLKDLVKKLELQNQHLRYKTGKLGPGHQPRSIQHDLLPEANIDIYSHLADGIRDDIRFKEVQRLSNCCWLYSLEKSYEDPVTLIAWLRHELDHPPTRTLEQGRKEVITMLDMELNNPSAVSIVTSNGKEDIGQTKELRKVEAGISSTRNTEPHFYSPPHDEQAGYVSHGLVHHMPLPSHTMTSKYGLIDVSNADSQNQHIVRSRRSASPGSQKSRGLSPSRRSESPSHYRSHRSPARKGHSPSRYSDRSDPHDMGDLPQIQTSARHRYRSPSPAGRATSSSKPGSVSYRDSSRASSDFQDMGDISMSQTSTWHRYRSPSPVRRATSPSKPASVSYRNSSRASSDNHSIVEVPQSQTSIRHRYRSPSPAGRGVSPSKSASVSSRDSFRNSNKEYQYSPRPGSPFTSKAESPYTPRSSGLKQPLSTSRLRTPRSMTRSAKSLLTQSDIRRTVSTEEVYRSSESLDSLVKSTYSPRKALPRPSHSSGKSTPKYRSPRSNIDKDSPRALYDQGDTHTRLDAKSDPDNVWNDGEFF